MTEIDKQKLLIENLYFALAWLIDLRGGYGKYCPAPATEKEWHDAFINAEKVLLEARRIRRSGSNA